MVFQIIMSIFIFSTFFLMNKNGLLKFIRLGWFVVTAGFFLHLLVRFLPRPRRPLWPPDREVSFRVLYTLPKVE